MVISIYLEQLREVKSLCFGEGFRLDLIFILRNKSWVCYIFSGDRKTTLTSTERKFMFKLLLLGMLAEITLWIITFSFPPPISLTFFLQNFCDISSAFSKSCKDYGCFADKKAGFTVRIRKCCAIDTNPCVTSRCDCCSNSWKSEGFSLQNWLVGSHFHLP